ncbi:LAGLIDADG family homing endonuclease [Natronosalvus amylolyticus]|uniref:LAGLIDADG family homing endonuclease n=1 Tax=Natronosalvus amylolyticus TaxID=2961994 RepID=UPI0020C9B00E|nr:LAGLIDADG family homing endonuclease [Natronosalvus amylolyticus]
MAQAGNSELVDAFEQFFRNYYDNEIKQLAQRYPNEQRSLYIDWQDLYRFDPNLADDYLSQPEQLQRYAEEALRLYDLPIDVSLGQAHVRIQNLPDTESPEIREIRARHMNTLVQVRGIVRKATDVRPKIEEAAFECQLCGTLNRIPQSTGDFQEPHECQGCERQGPFRVNFDQSEFVDAQKLRIQESPEGLRGGETPQAIDVNIEDDITGEVTPGDHVSAVGVLRLEQQGNQQEKSPIFDFYMEGMSVQVDEEQFEDMDITDEDKKKIYEISQQPDVYEQMIGSIAPAIYGYEEEKLAMMLQLFSGVTKHLPDGSRIRGDLHMLLIGDPGTGKCVAGNTRVLLGDGCEVPIKDLVESNLDEPKPIDDGWWDHVDFEVPSLQQDGTISNQQATKVWKREAPDQLYRIRTSSGRELEVTPSHPLFVPSTNGFSPRRAEELKPGQTIVTAPNPRPDTNGKRVEATVPDGGVRYTTTAQIESIDSVTPDDDWVYDLEIEGTHNYVSNGVISHNSQMLGYIQNIAPRSVYTSGKGSSSAGLCVTGDTLVHTSEGFRRIRDVATESHPEPVTDETSAERAIDLYTFDRDSGSLEMRPSSHVWRMPKKPCRRIETMRGKELEASRNTPVLTCGDDGIEWIRIADIEPGDHVAMPAYNENTVGDETGNTTIERDTLSIADFLEFTNEKLKLTPESIAHIRKRLCEEFGTLREAAATLELPEDFVYDTIRNRHVPLERLERILEVIDTDLADLSIDRAMLRHGDSIRIPDEFDEDLCYLFGFVVGDGDISVSRRGGNRGLVRISNSDELLLERAADIIDAKFDKQVEVEYHDDRVPCIRLNSATVARLFANLGMECPKNDLEIDSRLTTCEHADAFLRGLLDADGSVSNRSNGGSSIHFSTISEPLAKQVQLMLETYGVNARVRERDRRGVSVLENGYEIESKHVQYHLECYGKDIDRFAAMVGFGCPRKQAALEEITEDAARRDASIPIGGALAAVEGATGEYYMNCHRGDHPGRGRAKRIVDDLDLGPLEPLVEEAATAQLYWDEVAAAVDTGEKEVFDLTVPETHNFVANGIVTHNTAAAVRDDFGDGQQWTLEAGALVLADQGIAAVDELDKMRCVTGDTLVQAGDGIKPIREIAHEAALNGAVEHLENGRTIRDVDTNVWTMTDDGSLVKRDVLAVHEYEAPDELWQVELESGEQIMTTADHPFFVLEKGSRTEVSAENLTTGDWVYVPNSIPTEITDGGVTTLPVQNSSPRSSVSPLEPAFGAILGYLAGDGNIFYNRQEGCYGFRFTNKEEQLLGHFEEVCVEALGKSPVRHPSEQRADGVKTVRLHGKPYVDKLLNSGANLETYDGKRLPDAVSASSKETKAAFIRALADSEATVGKRAVKIYSSSYELLLGTKMLLLEFGVSSQIQTRERPRGRDLYVLAITSKISLKAFNRDIGFTLHRKQKALEEACDRTAGTRTILDVLPECGPLFEQARGGLRLYQSECGLRNSATYCNFENGDANTSLRLAKTIIETFKRRKRNAQSDFDELKTETSWDRLEELRNRYHISQSELAAEMAISQQQLSARWGTQIELRERVRNRLRSLLKIPSTVDLTPLEELIEGDVKWRRVASVTPVESQEHVDGRISVLKERLAEVTGTADPDCALEAASSLLNERDESIENWCKLRQEIDRYGITFQDIATELAVDSSTISRWFSGKVDIGNFDSVHAVCDDLIEEKCTQIQLLYSEIERRSEPKVYDLTVEGTHNFIANGMVVHNSEDRSAMHEALEQQKISVSKAGINATLKSRCSLLGAANPKYGRFDQYEPIGEQIELEPALISRFDLIFTVTDQPDEEKDRNLAEHILNTNYAGELTTQRQQMSSVEVSTDEIEAMTEKVDPVIDADLLRKYIAYSKQNCHPRMTEEAREAIRDFYVDLRSKGADEDAPVPVTARKLEGLVRLSEASARVRISDTVEIEDAERVIDIVRSCLQDIGVDPETGEFDADIVEAGTSKSQRDRIKNIKQLISDVEEEYDDGAPIDVVLERAEEIGMDESKAEHEIEKLKQKGEVYEPSTNNLRTT